MNADTHLHLILAKRESRLAGGRHRAAGQRHAHRAGALVDLVAERLEALQIGARFGCGADDLLHHQRAGNAAPARRIKRVLDRHIVIGDDGLDIHSRHFLRHLEIHEVALIILDDEEDAGSLIHRLRRGDHLVGGR